MHTQPTTHNSLVVPPILLLKLNYITFINSTLVINLVNQSLTNLLSCLFVCLFDLLFFAIVPPSGDQLSGLVLFHLKGITASLDPLLYKWICYKSPAPKVTPRHKAERERTKTTRQQSLPKTPSATTPRKKSFARGRYMKGVSCYLMWNVLRTSLCKNQTTGK